MFGQTLILVGGAFGLFTGFIIVTRIIRRMQSKIASAPLPPAFDMVELRKLFEEGKISAAEHERLRVVVLKQADERERMLARKGQYGFQVIAKANSQAPVPAAPPSAHTPSTDNPPAANQAPGV